MISRSPLPTLPAVFCLVALFFICSNSAFGHDLHAGSGPTSREVEAHRQLDFGFPGFKKLNQDLQRAFYSFDNRRNLAFAGEANRKLFVPDGHINGSWSPSFSLPLVPIHVMLLVDGRVLMWDSVGDAPAEDYEDHDFTRAAIWDPATNLVFNVDNTATGYNIFCAGFAHLPDGTPFLAGGNLDSGLNGINRTHLFNPLTNEWALGPTMTQSRWYPSVTPLANGEMLITSGSSAQNRHEVYTTSGTIRALSGFTLSMPLYPWLHASSDGRALLFGPNTSMRFINTAGTGSQSNAGTRDNIPRTYGSFAMYDIGRVVASGGAGSVRQSVIVDFRIPNQNPVSTETGLMNFGRRQHNLTVLPDGTVLATGGNSSGANLIDVNNNVYDAELWDPATGQWTVLSSAEKIRQYHSTSILLPDGRVLTGGGGICGTCHNVGYLEKNMEIFTPPYLYDRNGSGNLAPRPSISFAPGAVAYNDAFVIDTPQPANIEQVVMMRVSSVTHSVDFEQRRVPLTFWVDKNGLNARAPANSNIAPPGYYMLFVLDGDGVPSEARMMRVEFGDETEAPMIVASSGGGGSATLTWVPVNGATGYTVKYGTTSGEHTSSVATGNVTTLTLNNLQHWRHFFVVAPIWPTGDGEDSAEVEVQTNFVPTSAGVYITGRARTVDGRGLANVRISLRDSEGEEVRAATTNSFGFYRFEGVSAGRDYIATASAKRHRFSQSSILIRADDNIIDVDFISLP
ncbi:MAG TPA: DUF1929 domain-containing protein [Pyrinomonadaceae bacterium]|nr:DUF1929 domain-containing protein [Pyrinomonadaceae bacterium]HMP64335.1 DUF1929 domain-containing protein [Pyrinomonadaceae bacterium]